MELLLSEDRQIQASIPLYTHCAVICEKLLKENEL